uniref:Gag-pol polyprotein n=1 Tax=Solanum tuberosum TaxID=4113 RepID=M1DNI2_SOLTU
MNPVEFDGSKVEEDPQEFIDEGIRFSDQGFSNTPTRKFNKDRVFNPKPQGGNGDGSSMSSCARCGRKHEAKRVYRDCPVSLSHIVTHDDLVELTMLDFDVILGMDLLLSCDTSIDCKTQVVKFQFLNESILE